MDGQIEFLRPLAVVDVPCSDATVGFENLTGQNDNTDAFIVEAGGSIFGTVDGGTGGSDGLLIYPTAGASQIVEVSAADSAGTTSAVTYGKAVAYAHLDPQPFYDASDLANPVITGSVFDDTIRVYADSGTLKVERGSSTYAIGSAQLANLASLRIEGRAGHDTIDVESLPIALPDGVDFEDYVIGTFAVSFPNGFPVAKLAPGLAIEQSTGTWVPVPGETPEVRQKHVAKVIGVYEIPDYEWSVPTTVAPPALR